MENERQQRKDELRELIHRALALADELALDTVAIELDSARVRIEDSNGLPPCTPTIDDLWVEEETSRKAS